jgi:hypothetical protein
MNNTTGRGRALASALLLITASQGSGQADNRTPVVPLVALVAQPQQHAGAKVVTMGFCSLEFEGTLLYLHEEDYRQALMMNAIWLDVPSMRPDKPNPVHEAYCLVEGTFSARSTRVGAPGILEHITRLERAVSRAEHLDRAKR